MTGDFQTPQFVSVRAYGASQTDAGLWTPFVREVLARHDLGSLTDLRAGTAGTFPTMLVGDQLVVKVFGPLFDGYTAAQTEREVYRLLQTVPEIPAPAVIASGSLGAGDGRWEYIVSSQLPGESYLTVRDRLTEIDRRAVACFAARVMRHLHALKFADGGLLPPTRRDWHGFVQHLANSCVERHRAWGALPAQLIDQIETFLPSSDVLVGGPADWSLLHADLTADHILGEWRGGHWVPTGVIDFGDARIGDPRYELGSLHIECFACDKSMLRAFLEHVGWDLPRQRDFPRQALAMTLLHEFNVLKTVFDQHPDARDLPSLEALAAFLWNVD